MDVDYLIKFVFGLSCSCFFVELSFSHTLVSEGVNSLALGTLPKACNPIRDLNNPEADKDTQWYSFY